MTLPRISNANNGPRKMSGSRDADGHRTWKVVYRIRVAEDTDNPPFLYGPAAALQCPGLPIEGSLWIFNGMPGEVDVWAWCRSENTVSPVGVEGGPIKFYDVDFTFSTRPPGPDRGGRQQPESSYPRKEDPLAEQDKISGSFIKYSEEAALDRFGVPILSTSFEPLRGPQTEFDRNRPQIRIEQNVVDLQLPLLAQMCDTLNDRPLWGFPARCIKLGVPNWDRKFHGNGAVYFTRTLEFDICANVDPITGGVTSGFDRDLLDEGSKVLSGHWDTAGTTWQLDNLPDGSVPDPGNPAHYIRYKDRQGENARVVFTKDPDNRGQPIYEVLAGGITQTSNSSPIFITTTSDHGLVVGDFVAVSGVRGNEAANGVWEVTAILATNQFEITSVDGTPSSGDGNFDSDSFARWFKLSSDANKIHVEKYEESNFLRLGIPTGY